MSRLMTAAIPAAALLLLAGCEVTTPTVSVPQPVATPPVVVQSAPAPPTVVQTVPTSPPPPSTVVVP